MCVFPAVLGKCPCFSTRRLAIVLCVPTVNTGNLRAGEPTDSDSRQTGAAGTEGAGTQVQSLQDRDRKVHERPDPACVLMVSWPLMAFPSVLCTLHGAMKEGGLLLTGRSAVVSSTLRAESPGSWIQDPDGGEAAGPTIAEPLFSPLVRLNVD